MAFRYAATSPEIEQKGWNGVYLSDVVCFPTVYRILGLNAKCIQAQLGKETSQACDANLGADLWKLSEELVKEKLGNDALVDWNTHF